MQKYKTYLDVGCAAEKYLEHINKINKTRYLCNYAKIAELLRIRGQHEYADKLDNFEKLWWEFKQNGEIRPC